MGRGLLAKAKYMKQHKKNYRLYYIAPETPVRVWLGGQEWATLQASDFIGREARYKWAQNENGARFFYKGIIASFMGVPTSNIEIPELQDVTITDEIKL